VSIEGFSEIEFNLRVTRTEGWNGQWSHAWEFGVEPPFKSAVGSGVGATLANPSKTPPEMKVGTAQEQ